MGSVDAFVASLGDGGLGRRPLAARRRWGLLCVQGKNRQQARRGDHACDLQESRHRCGSPVESATKVNWMHCCKDRPRLRAGEGPVFEDDIVCGWHSSVTCLAVERRFETAYVRGSRAARSGARTDRGRQVHSSKSDELRGPGPRLARRDQVSRKSSASAALGSAEWRGQVIRTLYPGNEMSRCRRRPRRLSRHQNASVALGATSTFPRPSASMATGNRKNRNIGNRPGALPDARPARTGPGRSPTGARYPLST